MGQIIKISNGKKGTGAKRTKTKDSSAKGLIKSDQSIELCIRRGLNKKKDNKK